MMASLLFGIKYALRHWKIAGLIFVIQLIGAAFVGLLFQKDLSTHLGHSLAGRLMEEGFNFAVFKDLTRSIPDALSGVTTGFLVVLIIFLFLSIFLQGGAIKSLVDNDSKAMSILRNGKRYFFPFLLVAFISLLVLIICTAVLWFPLLSNFLPLNESLESDRLFFYLLYAVLLLYLFLVALIVSWSINTRINYAVLHESIWASMKAGVSWTVKKALPLGLVFFFFLGIGLLFMFLNVKLDKIDSIWVAFFGSLVFLFGRLVARLWYYGTLAYYASAIR